MTETNKKALPKILTLEIFEEWLKDCIVGDPAEARAFCERTMSPKFMRTKGGGDHTNFEAEVKKIAWYRQNCKKWDAPVQLFVQEGIKFAARQTVHIILEGQPEKEVELMLMGTRDDEGRIVNIWELYYEISKGEED